MRLQQGKEQKYCHQKPFLALKYPKNAFAAGERTKTLPPETFPGLKISKNAFAAGERTKTLPPETFPGLKISKKCVCSRGKKHMRLTKICAMPSC